MPGNMQNLMKQAQRMQRQMEESQKELETKEFTAKAGGGAVEATVFGNKTLKGIKISPEAVDPDDVEMLQDMIVAAINEAMKQAASFAIAGLIPDEELNAEHVIPAAFDPRVGTAVAEAVKKAAVESGVARKPDG